MWDMPPVSADFDGLDRLVAGEKVVWDRFVARFAPVIYAAVHRRLGPAGRTQDADDVAQDVFVRLCSRDFRLLRNVIATSTAIDHLRRQKGHTRDLDSVPEAALAVEPKEPTRLVIPPDLLSPRQAVVLEMLYQRDMDVAEVAEVLAVEPQTVRSTHHKALVRLRAHFREEEP